jgi:transposase
MAEIAAQVTAVSGVEVVGGVDTHRDTVWVAVIDSVGRQVADREFATTPAGYAAAVAWLVGHGRLLRVGVEGTGCYGAGLAAVLRTHRIEVVEVDRPDRAARRRVGKSDPTDAYAAAWAALSGRAATIPKPHDGPVEAIRVLALTRSSAVKARTEAINQLKALLVTAPPALRDRLRDLTPAALITACAALQPASTDPTDPLTDPLTTADAYPVALATLAHRYQQLTTQISALDRQLDTLTAAAAPRLRATPGVGPQTAATLLTAAGDNPDRLRCEAAFAHLCAAAPIPASSGRTTRHRLNRGGHRQANAALHRIVITRLRIDPTTRAYAARRHTEGKTRREIIRCLKRYLARQLYPLLITDLTHTNPPTQDQQTAA